MTRFTRIRGSWPARTPQKSGGSIGWAPRVLESLFMKRICVFCGSSEGVRPAYADGARKLAGELACRRIGLVYGGGSVGLMGVLANEVLLLKGEVIGVIPRPLATRELAHTGLSEMRI